MRNLKRALSLGLTAAMISGLMVMGSSAAGSTYADVADTDNVEAIEVLKAVGIMVGDDQGNFNPDATVSRNEMAVVMSNLMAYNVATYRDTSPFTDVPEWAEPYVAACYTNGITAGYDATTYGGNDAVTTAQAALMVMKALGYFQYQSDFGGDWQLSTVAQGNRIDLFIDVDSAVKDPMTRNDLAQLVLNALEAGTVEAEAGSSIIVGGVTITNDVKYNYITSGEKYANAINSNLETSIDQSNTSGSIVQLGEKLYQGDLTKDESYDEFGRPANIWEYQAKEIGTFEEEADHTFTAKVTSKALYDAIGRTAMDYRDWTVTVDGNEVNYTGSILNNNKTDDDKCFLEKGISAAEANRTGNGVLTEVYVDGTDRKVDIAITHYYAAEVYEVNEDDGYITLNAFYGPADTNDEFDTTAAFEEDEIVMYSFANGEVREVYAAERLEGEVTNARVNTVDSEGDRFYIDGNSDPYNYNHTTDKDERLLTENVNNVVVVYLDRYGYASYVDESAMTYDYAYVLSMGTDGDQYDKDGKGNTVYARLVLTDGTIIKVETDAKERQIPELRNHIVSYSADKNDVYTLTARDLIVADKMQGTEGIKDAANDTALYIENGVASFKAPNGPYTANSNTVFIVADSDPDDYDDYEFTVYTGIKNVPDIEGQDEDGMAQVDVAATKDGVAKVVYIEDADVSGLKNVIFARAASDAKLVKDSEIGNFYEINAVVDGETVTLNVKENSTAAAKLVDDIDPDCMLPVSTASTNSKWIVALESITENSDGLVTNVRLYEEAFNKATPSATDGDGVWQGTGTDDAVNETVSLDGTRYAWTDEVVVVRYNYKGDFEVSRISSIKEDHNDQFLAVMDSTVINGVCILEKEGMGEGTTVTPGEAGSDSVSGYDVNVSVTDADVSNDRTLKNKVAELLRDAGYKRVNTDYVTFNSTEGVSADGGYATAEDADGNEFDFDVTYTNYWTIKVDDKIVDTVVHEGESEVVTDAYLEALESNGGTGFVCGSNYEAYENATASAVSADDVTAAIEIETGYAQLASGASLNSDDAYEVASNAGTSKGSMIVTGTLVEDTNVYYKVADGLKVEYELGSTGTGTDADTPASSDMIVEVELTGADVSVSQNVAKAKYYDGNKLTFNIDTDDVAKDATAVTITDSVAPVERAITYEEVDLKSTGLTEVSLSGVKTAMDGKTVEVTITIKGTASTDTTLTVTATNGSTVAWTSDLSAGLDYVGGKLKITQGVKIDTTVTCEFTLNGNNDVTVSGALS